MNLQQLRKKYADELEKNLKVAIGIRDDPETPEKEKINAIKEINWILGVRKPEKVATKDKKGKEKSPFTPKEEKEIQERVKQLLGKI